MITLFENKITNASVIKKLSDDRAQKGIDKRTIAVSGVFGGATVTITASVNGVTFFPLSGGSFTSAVAKLEELSNELYVKAEITGATGTTSIDAYIV